VNRLVLLAFLPSPLLFACGSSDDPSGGSGGVFTATGGISANGGTTTGGAPGSGGVLASGGTSGASGGVNPATGGAPSSGGAGNTGGTAAGGSASGGTSSGGTSSGGSGGGVGGAPATGIFPPVTDSAAKGSFTAATITNTGPSSTYTIIHPTELGKDGVKHPIVVWGNGAVMSPPLYKPFLDHVASHGFVIIAYNATPEAAQMTAALDYIIAENAKSGGQFAGKLDTAKVAAMGHSAGSVATFKIASDARLTTTLHWNGGTFSPHTEVQNVKKPSLHVCGDAGGDGLIVGDVARANCDVDFTSVKAPIWYGNVIGSSHMTIAAAAGDALLKHYQGAVAGWLRWQLAGDETMKALFVGPSCALCGQSTVWKVQQRDLN
jgi:hypothetical protein